MGPIKWLVTAVMMCLAGVGMVPAAAMAAGDPTTLTLSESPAPTSTNQPVTLTATVTGEARAPAGTVWFANRRTIIPGCGYRPLIAVSSDTSTATCTLVFTAATSPEVLTARYRGGDHSGPSRTASPVVFPINKSATSTTLTASGTKPSVGANVTYTALVIPAVTGAAQPYGHVEFTDGATVISGCAMQPVITGATTCTTAYPTAGVHQIIAHYLGDTDFTGSRSAVMTVHAMAPSSGGAIPAPAISTLAVGGATVRGRSASVPVSCSASGPGCTVAARLLRITRSRRWVDHRFRTVTRTSVLGSVKATVAAGHKHNLTLTLNRRGRRLLARRHRLKLRLSVTQLVGHRTVATVSRPVRFRAPTRRRAR